jgi:hypothetical protein
MGVVLSGAAKARFIRAHLSDGAFTRCNVTDGDFSHAYLCRSRMWGLDVHGVNFEECYLNGVLFTPKAKEDDLIPDGWCLPGGEFGKTLAVDVDKVLSELGGVVTREELLVMRADHPEISPGKMREVVAAMNRARVL